MPNLTQVLCWRLSHLKRDWKEEMHQYLLCFIINLFSSDKESFTQNLTNTGQKAILDHYLTKKGWEQLLSLKKILSRAQHYQLEKLLLPTNFGNAVLKVAKSQN